jgi:hypothetical protein
LPALNFQARRTLHERQRRHFRGAAVHYRRCPRTLLPVLLFQVIALLAAEEIQQNKGNALSLNTSEGPVNLALKQGDPADDGRRTTKVLLKHEDRMLILFG